LAGEHVAAIEMHLRERDPVRNQRTLPNQPTNKLEPRRWRTADEKKRVREVTITRFHHVYIAFFGTPARRPN
jgi:hypothetical protein